MTTLLRKLKSPLLGRKPEKPGNQSFLIDQCDTLNCKAVLITDHTKFFVCSHQLAHASEFFRSLFVGDRSQKDVDDVKRRGDGFLIVVGPGGAKPERTQFQWFLESVVPNPVLKDITDETLETLMRLSQRFRARGLAIRCADYMRNNCKSRAPMTVLYWITWAVTYNFDAESIEACQPAVVRLPLIVLEEYRNLLKDRVFGNLVAAKLRAAYDQAVDVYQMIHKQDHFHTEMEKCPKCHKKAGERPIKIEISPCRKLLACSDCMKEYPCVCEPGVEYQAMFQCEHGSRVLSDRTTDCFCQKYNFNPGVPQPCDCKDYEMGSIRRKKNKATETPAIYGTL